MGCGAGAFAGRRRPGQCRRAGKLAVAALAPALLVAPAYGQVALDEIVVTAQKRPQVLADVPAAVGVFSAEDVERLGYTTSSDFVRQTPNLMWHSVLGFATSDFPARHRQQHVQR